MSTRHDRRREPRDFKPRDFIAVKGPGRLQIRPQTPRGWRMTLVWTVALLAPHVPLTVLAVWVDDTPREIWVLLCLAPVLLINGLTIWAMIRWMLNRAEIVSPEE